jgi:RNA polymerase sigma factor for flagellar operon FliA
MKGDTSYEKVPADATDERNLKLVVDIVDRIRRKVPADVISRRDLIGTGNLALLRAVGKFDPERHNGTPFQAFARQKIRGAILDAVRAIWCDGTGRHGLRPRLESLDAITDSIGRLRQGHTSTADQRALERAGHPPGVEKRIDRTRLIRRVSEAIGRLPENERTVLSLWHADDEPHPRAIARLMGLSVEAATSLHDRAIENLQADLLPHLSRTEPKAA